MLKGRGDAAYIARRAALNDLALNYQQFIFS